MSQRKHVLYVVGFLCCLLISQLILPAPALHAQEGLPLNVMGDIASCISDGDEGVAALLDNQDGLIMTLGDNVYPSASLENLQNCFEPNFGRFKDRLYAIPGNHDIYQGTLDNYFAYFGDHAGPAGQGYYSFNYGSWHIIALNSIISLQPTLPQYEWLRADLAANPTLCTLVAVHNPMFHSGSGGRSPRIRPAFQLMYEMGVDVIVSADAHHYERFSPMNPDGKLDAERGVRQFVVGTGGASHTRLAGRWRTTEVRENTTFGITRFFLRDGGYSWRFIPVAGGTFTDTGDWTCH